MANQNNYAALLDRIRDGDSQAETELVNCFWRGLVFLLYKQTGDIELSRDIAQDALLVVISKAREGLIEKPEALRSYVRGVGENSLIGLRRKEARRKTDAATDVVENVAESGRSLFELVSADEVAGFVRDQISQLGQERDQEILKRHYLLGQDKVRICDALGLTSSQADTVLHRARQRLKDAIVSAAGDNGGPRLGDILTVLVVIVIIPLTGSGQATRVFHAKPTETAVRSHLLCVMDLTAASDPVNSVACEK